MDNVEFRLKHEFNSFHDRLLGLASLLVINRDLRVFSWVVTCKLSFKSNQIKSRREIMTLGPMYELPIGK
jgi:hypothetical protein